MHESSQSKENNPNKMMYTIINIILSLNFLKLMFHQLAKYCYILLISQVKSLSLRIWSNSSSKMSYDSYDDGNSRVEEHVWLATRRPNPSRELKVMVIT